MLNALFVKQIEKTPLLKKEEERALIEKMQKGDRKAFERLIVSNLRFVLKMAGKYKNCGIDIEDLFVDGTIGLMEALGKFDLSRNTKIITYAVHYIKKEIEKAIFEGSSGVRLPKTKKGRQLLADKIFGGLSLNLKCGKDDDKDSELVDFVSDTEILVPDAALERKETENAVRRSLSVLNEKELAVIKMRFGFEGKAMSLEKIGEKLNYTKEGVRLIEKKGLSKLKEELVDFAA